MKYKLMVEGEELGEALGEEVMELDNDIDDVIEEESECVGVVDGESD